MGRSAVMLAIVLATGGIARSAEQVPPAPDRYFNDYVGVVPRDEANRLNAELEQFERDTSNQLLVAVYPHMTSDSSLEDYTTRVYTAWKVGQKGRDNGAVLFVYTQDRRMRIATGYGLEGALPDALCKRILQDVIAPRLRAGDFAGGLAAGTRAMIAAAKGEYRGSGRTVAEGRGNAPAVGIVGAVIGFIFFVTIIRAIARRGSSVLYHPRGRRNIWANSGWGGWGGGGNWGGGGGWSGGGGGFSGGGGGTGGGGASGSW